ncbi:MAG: hypothetical protein HYR73_07835 [Candidatus Eisenbacteria bacterium]|nr:hypothetical protein [Candidatus Eisenbacteria bacterium]
MLLAAAVQATRAFALGDSSRDAPPFFGSKFTSLGGAVPETVGRFDF